MHQMQSIQEHQIIAKIQQVYQTGITSLTAIQIKQYNSIDRQYANVQLVAEQKCQKFHTRKIPWTPLLTQAIYQVLYWKGIRKHILVVA